jgi:hypothetical protein
MWSLIFRWFSSRLNNASVILPVLFFLLICTVPVTGQQEYRIYIHPTSKVTVYGSTNVNNFKFKYTENIFIDKPVKVKNNLGTLQLSGGIIDLKVRAFDSGNSIMNKDFRKMLLEEENPFIQVELSSLAPTWLPNEVWREGKADIFIVINQVVKKYTVSCKVENPGSLLIYGTQRILLTDFGLTPPVRMMGMVKVTEWVDLDFALRFATDR